MLPPKNKKGPVGVMIAVGEEKPPKLGVPGEKPSMDEPEPVDNYAEESEEGRDYGDENDSDYGAKLMADIEAVGAEFGADPAMSREIAGKLLSAIGRCLSGESASEMDPIAEHDAGGESFEGDGSY